MAQLIGIILLSLGGLSTASFYVPSYKIQKWSWGSTPIMDITPLITSCCIRWQINLGIALVFTIVQPDAVKAALPDVKLAPENIALGKKYTYCPKPIYRHCTDPGDAIQLTDGKLTKGCFWIQKGCVGWQPRNSCISITIDLGHLEPIQGVSFRTAAGTAGVAWPAAIKVAVSDDGKNYRVVSDLVEQAFNEGESWPKGYVVRRFVTTGLHTRGRFVRMVVVSAGAYAFCDEIEVFRGPDAWLNDDPAANR